MNRKGVGIEDIGKLVLWAAVILLVSYLIYHYLVKGGSGPLPGEGLLP